MSLTETENSREYRDASPVIPVVDAVSPFIKPRQYLENKYVYLTLSYRARGLSIGINVNPDKMCNFDCVYCEVDRRTPGKSSVIDLDDLIVELENTLSAYYSGELKKLAAFRDTPPELLELKHVGLSGDGEPALCPQFAEIVERIVHLRALGKFPFFKITLVTNSSGFHLPWVQAGLELFTPADEIWAKLDAGTQEFMDKINRPKTTLRKIMSNIALVGKKRPIVIQTLFPSIRGELIPENEIDAYCDRLLELKSEGVMISYIQIHSARRPVTNPECGHLPLRELSRIARKVREKTGLKVEVF